MKWSYRVFLVFMVFLLVLPMHSPALDNQNSPANSTMGNLTGPFLTINKIPVHCVNETFNVTGTTSLLSGTRLRVTVYRGSFNPGIPPQQNPWYDALKKEIRVVNDSHQGSIWIYTLNTSGSYPDEYIVTVEPYGAHDVNATMIFNLDNPCDTGSIGGSVTPANQDRINILVTITNTAQEKSDLNGTTGHDIKPLNPVPVSNMKKIKAPEQNESPEKQKEMFSDRDWVFIRKSMTDLTGKEQDQLIAEMEKILNNTSSLSPDEQTNVSLRIGYYIINATDGGKPVNSSDLPGLPKEKSAQTSASIPLTIPLIAMGGFGIIRLLLLQNDKK